MLSCIVIVPRVGRGAGKIMTLDAYVGGQQQNLEGDMQMSLRGGKINMDMIIMPGFLIML
jgi:hypothetical protein